MENHRLQQNVEVAHIPIAKNLEKIQKLEARNNCLDNKKSSEVELVQTLSEKNTKPKGDWSLKEEYVEYTKDFSLKEEKTEDLSLKEEYIV